MLIAAARRSVCLAVLLLLVAGAGSAAERYDPRLRFRTIRTAHFDIHAHQGEEALARRLATIVERVRLKFEPELGRARGRVHVILVDQTDLSNGWATPFPYDTIEITAVPPASESSIGNTTDWLELVFTHEYTHILHLDRTRGFMNGVRHVFGRGPIVFPNAFLPVWQVEGIATYEESRMTGEGRIPAGDFRAIVDLAAARGRFEPIDRVSGGLTDWPAGQGAYAYGAYFHQFLADRYGPERLSRLADATAGRVPLFGGGAFKKVFGKSAPALWNEFRVAHEHGVSRRSDTDEGATRLTHHGFVVSAPAVAEDGAIYYRTSNPDGFPALMRLAPGAVPVRVAWRTGGSRTALHDDWVVFDQVERVRSVAIFADLYAVRAAGGPVHRLTREARAEDADVSPDGKTIVCTVQATGRRALATLAFNPSALSTPRLLVDDPQSDFTGPRWSPDGRQIVAARRRAGLYELVLVDPVSGTVRSLVARHNARLVTPSWTHDGSTVLFAADTDDGPFNIQAVDIATGTLWQVTDTLGGAQYPSFSMDGRLTYVGYTPDGSDLFSLATDPSSWNSLAASENLSNPSNPVTPSDPLNPETNPSNYHPWSTLVPTYWSPVVTSDAGETLVGAGTAMTDALGRQSYAIDAAWSTHRARPDWHAAYAYDRWRPTFFASYSDDTDPVRGGEINSREIFAGALVAFRHVRFTESVLAGFDAETDQLTCTGSCRASFVQRDLRSIRAGWLHDSRRQFGYSISAEEGFAVEAAAETSRQAFGSDGDAGSAVIDVRGFHRVLSQHTVLAARTAVAASWGDMVARRVFSAAGSGPTYAAFDFGRDAIGLLRGVDPEDVTGTRALVLNVDLRVPIARPQRGRGTFPLFLHSVHGAAFIDAANAWDASFHAADLRTSLGGELSTDIIAVHYLPLTVAAGAAWTHDPVARHDRAAFFVRAGYAF